MPRNKPDPKDEAPATDETTDATEAAETDEAAETPTPDPIADMSTDDAATLLAAKQAAGEAKPWGPFKKASTEIPGRLVGAEFSILQPKIGDTPEATWANILTFADGHQAALDTFNSAYRLANQKELKGNMQPGEGEDPATVADLQERSNRHTVSASTRGRGGKGTAKARAVRAEAKVSAQADTMEAMLAELREVDPEKAEAFAARMAALNAS